MMQSYAADKKITGHRHLRCALWSLAGVLAVFLGICLRFGFYWDLNDDYLIDHILRGAYTGEPEIRDIQNLFPFSAILAGLQKLLQAVDIYAVLLVLLQFASMWIVVDRAAVFSGRAGNVRVLAAILSGVAALLLLVAELWYHLVFVQYSVTVGMMSAAVIAMIMTTERSQVMTPDGNVSIRRILRTLAGAFALVFLGFGLRSEMLLFCSPFIALAALIRGIELFVCNDASECGENQRAQKRSFTRGNAASQRRFRHLFTWLLTIGLTCLLGLGILKGCDLAGYHSPAWQRFEAFFDARTQLYDFQWTWMKHYEEDAAWYDAAGLDSSEVALLWNYNFGLDEDITEENLQTIASHAADTAAAQSSARERLRGALYAYRNTLQSPSERPWNMISPALYVVVIFTMLMTAFSSKSFHAADGATSNISRTAKTFTVNEHAMDGTTKHNEHISQQEETCPGKRNAGKRLLLQLLALFLLFACRSSLYLYLLYHQRPVVRLTHCLYLLESICLLFFLLQILRDGHSTETETIEKHQAYRVVRNILQGAVACILIITLLLSVRRQTAMSASEYTRREDVNRDWTTFLAYVSDHPDNFYFTDVYSTVVYSEKLSAVNAAYPLNWDLAGGWACKSPLWEKKLSRYQIQTMETALPAADNVYFVSSPERDTDWLVSYYAYKGRKVQVEETDRISDAFSVYRVKTMGSS